MSTIKIRGRADVVVVPYSLAKKVKQRKFGDETVSPPIPKASPKDLIDLGDVWSGEYGQIVAIELNDKPSSILPQIAEPELTPEQKKMAKEQIRKIGEDFGFITKKKSHE